jgi:hypothetical protein
MLRLERDWKRLSRQNLLQLLPDLQYRERVIDDCLGELRNPVDRQRALSAVDRVVRNILVDPSVGINAFVTFNVRDFADVCGRVGMELVY